MLKIKRIPEEVELFEIGDGDSINIVGREEIFPDDYEVEDLLSTKDKIYELEDIKRKHGLVILELSEVAGMKDTLNVNRFEHVKISQALLYAFNKGVEHNKGTLREKDITKNLDYVFKQYFTS